jgi:hypothetical protein
MRLTGDAGREGGKSLTSDDDQRQAEEIKIIRSNRLEASRCVWASCAWIVIWDGLQGVEGVVAHGKGGDYGRAGIWVIWDTSRSMWRFVVELWWDSSGDLLGDKEDLMETSFHLELSIALPRFSFMFYIQKTLSSNLYKLPLRISSEDLSILHSASKLNAFDVIPRFNKLLFTFKILSINSLTFLVHYSNWNLQKPQKLMNTESTQVHSLNLNPHHFNAQQLHHHPTVHPNVAWFKRKPPKSKLFSARFPLSIPKTGMKKFLVARSSLV